MSEPNQPAGDPSSPPTRTSLIKGFCARDPERLAEFAEVYGSLLRAYVGDCLRRIGARLSEGEREDIQQELWIKLHHALPKFELHARFRTWLWKVTRNLVIDWLRREHGRGNRSKHVPLTPQLLEQLGCDDEPDQGVIQAHQEHVLRHILAKVKTEMQSAHKWDCFERHYLGGEPSARVAETLKLSVSAVNTYTSRVLTRIRELRTEYDGEPA